MNDKLTPKEIASIYRIAEIRVHQIQQLFGIDKEIDFKGRSTIDKNDFKAIADKYPEVLERLQNNYLEAHS